MVFGPAGSYCITPSLPLVNPMPAVTFCSHYREWSKYVVGYTISTSIHIGTHTRRLMAIQCLHCAPSGLLECVSAVFKFRDCVLEAS